MSGQQVQVDAPMTQDTMQFIYKALVIGFLIAFVAIIGGLIASIFHFGDGEAVKIIADLTPAVLGAFGSMALVFVSHAGVTAMQTVTAARLQENSQTLQSQQLSSQNGASGGAQGH